MTWLGLDWTLKIVNIIFLQSIFIFSSLYSFISFKIDLTGCLPHSSSCFFSHANMDSLFLISTNTTNTRQTHFIVLCPVLQDFLHCSFMRSKKKSFPPQIGNITCKATVTVGKNVNGDCGTNKITVTARQWTCNLAAFEMFAAMTESRLFTSCC